MSIVRKPHNLVTAYWDDSEYFLQLAEVAERQNKASEHGVLFPNEKRGMRYCILSSFLFLEAFINAEHFDAMGLKQNPDEISLIQKGTLNKAIMETYFEDKWSKWIEDISGAKIPNIKGCKQFQDIKKLKEWRHALTHYKMHDLMLVAKEIETIEISREAHRIAKQSIQWYFELTKLNVPDWIKRDILSD